MVVRPPVETWTRPQLEDNYHKVHQSNLELKSKCNDYEKKLTQLMSRIRRLSQSGKPSSADEDRMKTLEKENQLMAMKLKSLKHQLLIYTTPSARQQTSNAMTGRSTFRPMSTGRRGTSRPRGEEEGDRSSVRFSEASLTEKATIIKLNRALRERNDALAEQQYELESMSKKVHELRAKLELSSKTSVKQSIKRRKAEERGEGESGRGGESGRSDTANTTQRSDSQRSSSSSPPVSHPVPASSEEMSARELDMARQEIGVLKAANERLVRESLEREFDSGGDQLLEVERRCAELEEQLKECERSASEEIRRSKTERHHLEHTIKEKERMLGAMKKEIAALRQNPSTPSAPAPPPPPPLSDEEETSYREERKRRREKKKAAAQQDDVLMRLYRDVAGIIQAHDPVPTDALADDGLGVGEKLAKWQRMYAELYEELEKVRNMLLLQHDINQKQAQEIALLREESSSAQTRYKTGLDEMRQVVAHKENRISVLEEQIRSIAYGKQKMIPSGESKPVTSSSSAELTVRFSSIQLHSATAEDCPQYFLSTEFYDFELQTTPILCKPSLSVDFQTVYSVLVSQLFLHYLQSNGVTVELYRPLGTAYELVAAGSLSLRQLLDGRKRTRFTTTLRLVHLSTGKPAANIECEVTCSQALGEAITAYQRQEAAQRLVPLTIPVEPSFNELTVTVNRVHIKGAKLSTPVCVVYELFSFSPYFTDFIDAKNLSTLEFASSKTWMLPRSSATKNHLRSGDISLFLVENTSSADGDGVICMVGLSLSPLERDRKIAGTFNMITATGEASGVSIDVSIAWKHGAANWDDQDKPVHVKPPMQPVQPPTVQPARPPPVNKPSSSSSSSSPSSSSSSASVTSEEDVSRPSESSEQPPPVQQQRSVSSEGSVASVIRREPKEDMEPPADMPGLASSDESSSSASSDSAMRLPVHQPIERPGVSVTSGTSDDVFERNSDTDRRVEPVPLPKPKQKSYDDDDVDIGRLEGSPPREEDKKEEEREEPKRVPSGEYDNQSDRQSVRSEQSVHSEKSGKSERSEKSDKSEKSSVRSEEKGSKDERQSVSSEEQKERDRDEIRSMLGPLPPLAKPRLSKPPEPLKKDPSQDGRHLFFKEPLHHSIPPSEASSSSPRSPKPAVPLPPRSPGKSNIPEHYIQPVQPDSPADARHTVTVQVQRLFLTPNSPLLRPSLAGLRVSVDWLFLDFPQEECTVPGSLELPRTPDDAVEFGFTKTYVLSRRRVALLEQWAELANRFNFTIISDDGANSDELASAQIDMRRLPTHGLVSLACYDIDNEHIADLEVVVDYSDDTYNAVVNKEFEY